MKNRMKLLCGFLALAGLNCGGSALDPQSTSEESPTSEDQSSLIKSIVATQNPDRTWKQTVIYQTREAYRVEFAARSERQRLRKEGIEMAQSEIGPGNCGEADSLWVWQGGGQAGQRCCLTGTSWGVITNMCGASFNDVGSLWASNTGGYYSTETESCTGNFTAWEYKESLGCSWLYYMAMYEF